MTKRSFLICSCFLAIGIFATVGGAQLGSTITQSGIAVTNGIFSVSLDFGNQFPGAGRFLEIRVRPSGGGALTTLAPRHAIISTPYAVKSLSSDNATSNHAVKSLCQNVRGW